jgi:hypothetical protein
VLGAAVAVAAAVGCAAFVGTRAPDTPRGAQLTPSQAADIATDPKHNSVFNYVVSYRLLDVAFVAHPRSTGTTCCGAAWPGLGSGALGPDHEGPVWIVTVRATVQEVFGCGPYRLRYAVDDTSGRILVSQIPVPPLDGVGKCAR